MCGKPVENPRFADGEESAPAWRRTLRLIDLGNQTPGMVGSVTWPRACDPKQPDGFERSLTILQIAAPPVWQGSRQMYEMHVDQLEPRRLLNGTRFSSPAPTSQPSAVGTYSTSVGDRAPLI